MPLFFDKESFFTYNISIKDSLFEAVRKLKIIPAKNISWSSDVASNKSLLTDNSIFLL
jgi:hypothetical protein